MFFIAGSSGVGSRQFFTFLVENLAIVYAEMSFIQGDRNDSETYGQQREEEMVRSENWDLYCWVREKKDAGIRIQRGFFSFKTIALVKAFCQHDIFLNKSALIIA